MKDHQAYIQTLKAFTGIYMTDLQKAQHIRCMITASAICQYQLLKLVDSSHHELKQKIKFALKACKSVENYFILHDNASPETKETFRQQFLGSELLLLSELLEVCFGVSEDGLEEIITAVKNNIEVTN